MHYRVCISLGQLFPFLGLQFKLIRCCFLFEVLNFLFRYFENHKGLFRPWMISVDLSQLSSAQNDSRLAAMLCQMPIFDWRLCLKSHQIVISLIIIAVCVILLFRSIAFKKDPLNSLKPSPIMQTVAEGIYILTVTQ